MKITLKSIPLMLVMTFLMVQCAGNEDANNSNTADKTAPIEEQIKTYKVHPNDPFSESMTESQYFELDPTKDNLIEGENGTLIVAPKGCFLDLAGNPVTENVKIELTESLTLDEMLLSNLTTLSNGELLETDGMLFLNATANGEQLKIDEKNPLYIEVPTDEVKPGMMAYKGVRDEAGNMNWIEPKALENFLVSLDFKYLDFLPPGFAEAVHAGMPFRGHETANQALIDSLYYSLSVSNGSELTDGFNSTDLNEAYYNDYKVVGGKYTDASYNSNSTQYDDVEVEVDSSAATKESCGVDPAKIKVLKSKKFQHTLISTREFESRLKLIFKVCQREIIDLYINNLEKDMWEIDQLAANQLKGTKYEADFLTFSAKKETNVEGGKKYAATLKTYYEKELKAIKSELEALKNKAINTLKTKNEVAKQMADEYRDLLWKRENFRMQKYGFQWSSTGWINVDRGTVPKDWGPQPLTITIDNAELCDQLYTYVVYTSIKSLYRLNSNDGSVFYVGNTLNRTMLMPKKALAVAISVGYQNEQPYLSVREFKTGDPNFNMTLEKSSTVELKNAIKAYDNYKTENKIDVDLKYMTFFAKERLRQRKLLNEQRFIVELWNLAHPCCPIETKGPRL